MNPLESTQHSITTPLISDGQPLDAVGPQAQQSHPKRISPSPLSLVNPSCLAMAIKKVP
ncbi:hypothetical protein GMO17_09315 [Pseudomonas coronafaciens pv. coronafaciens]|uniref:Uncharacterized protein n=1 Tax=Pseudomonas coronafaciens pv. coronafaciens TaxID=235275 RepID=A0AAE6QEN1_9PSED|nr:hypothetical protein GMO17_09315 [Pseudomonas coronafaciens pv. coronafaciens]